MTIVNAGAAPSQLTLVEETRSQILERLLGIRVKAADLLGLFERAKAEANLHKNALKSLLKEEAETLAKLNNGQMTLSVQIESPSDEDEETGLEDIEADEDEDEDEDEAEAEDDDDEPEADEEANQVEAA